MRLRRSGSVHTRILNELWLLRDAKGQAPTPGASRISRTRSRSRVRVVWDGGHGEWSDGQARRWTNQPRKAVFVEFSDDRRSRPGGWVKPEDVERR